LWKVQVMVRNVALNGRAVAGEITMLERRPKGWRAMLRFELGPGQVHEVSIRGTDFQALKVGDPLIVLHGLPESDQVAVIFPDVAVRGARAMRVPRVTGERPQV
jgi:hypothetical protein